MPHVSYRGIAKNKARAKVRAALVYLFIARRRLAPEGMGTFST